MDKMREEFEAEYIKSLNNNYFSCEEEKLIYIKKDDSGEYAHDATYSAFHWWKSSRAALCVKMPSSWYQDQEGYILNMEDDVKSCLDDAGVRYE